MLKRILKKNSHNSFFKALAGLGRSINRHYENRNHDIQSNGEQTILRKIATLHPRVIIDGGANLGDYALCASTICPKSKIYSFEPVKDTFDQLSKNIQKYPNILPIQKGLYNSNCKKKINIFSSNEHSSIYDLQGISYESTHSQEIELVKGDDFLQENDIRRISLLKLDLEGAEYDALVGFENALKSQIIDVVQFEYGYINITTKKLLIDYYKFFETCGYIVGKVFPKNVEFRKYSFKYEDFIGPNHVAVKKSEIELIKLLESKK